DVLDKNIALLGEPADSVGHARFLRSYSATLTFLVPDGVKAGDSHVGALRDLGVKVVETCVDEILPTRDGTATVVLKDGKRMEFDAVYPMLGCTNRSELARRLGAKCAEAGDLICDAHLQTSVPGLYAAGDVVNALNQV